MSGDKSLLKQFFVRWKIERKTHKRNFSIISHSRKYFQNSMTYIWIILYKSLLTKKKKYSISLSFSIFVLINIAPIAILIYLRRNLLYKMRTFCFCIRKILQRVLYKIFALNFRWFYTYKLKVFLSLSPSRY